MTLRRREIVALIQSGHLRHCSETVRCWGYNGPIQPRGLTTAIDPKRAKLLRGNRYALRVSATVGHRILSSATQRPSGCHDRKMWGHGGASIASALLGVRPAAVEVGCSRRALLTKSNRRAPWHPPELKTIGTIWGNADREVLAWANMHFFFS
jgi:hypothetical protein